MCVSGSRKDAGKEGRTKGCVSVNGWAAGDRITPTPLPGMPAWLQTELPSQVFMAHDGLGSHFPATLQIRKQAWQRAGAFRGVVYQTSTIFSGAIYSELHQALHVLEKSATTSRTQGLLQLEASRSSRDRHPLRPHLAKEETEDMMGIVN